MDVWKYRISLSIAGLARGSFKSLGIPVPSVVAFRDNSISRTKSDGGQSLQGYYQVEIMWDILTGPQYHKVRRFIDQAKPGLLYLTIDIGDGSAFNKRWVDIEGRPHRQEDLSQSGPLVSRNAQSLNHFENVVLFINNVRVVNNPSDYSEV